MQVGIGSFPTPLASSAVPESVFQSAKSIQLSVSIRLATCTRPRLKTSHAPSLRRSALGCTQHGGLKGNRHNRNARRSPLSNRTVRRNLHSSAQRPARASRHANQRQGSSIAMKKCLARLLCVVLVLSITVDASAFLPQFFWQLLGRASVRAVAQAGRVGSRAPKPRADFSWVEREVSKQAIRQIIRNSLRRSDALPQAEEQALTENDCFLIEFAGDSNYVTNYCESRVEIRGFIQHLRQENRLVEVGCNPLCVFNPGEMHQLLPRAGVGPFVSAEIRSVQPTSPPPSRSAYSSDVACPSILRDGVWTCMPGTEGGRLPSAGIDCPKIPQRDGTWRCM